MDPSKFKLSTLPLNHTVYGAISRERLMGANANKLAVITGAGRGRKHLSCREIASNLSHVPGIGRAIAEALAASGANVAVIDLKVENLSETKAACESLGVRVMSYACDVTDGARVKSTFDSIRKDMGPIE